MEVHGLAPWKRMKSDYQTGGAGKRRNHDHFRENTHLSGSRRTPIYKKEFHLQHPLLSTHNIGLIWVYKYILI